MVLQGALERVFVLPNANIDRHLASYQFPLVAVGAWTAELLYPTADGAHAVPVGFAAMDQDPDETGLVAGAQVEVLLMRDDTTEPSRRDLVTPSGYLKPSSRLPIAVPVGMSGPTVKVFRAEGTVAASMTLTAKRTDGTEFQYPKMGNRRYVTGLVLQRVRAENGCVFRRVGLCQMYHFIWEEELADREKRKETVIVL